MFNLSHIRLDAKGRALTGERRYTITFKPPMPFAEPTILTGFWSVTMHDGITKLAVQNPINRYSLGSDNVLRKTRTGRSRCTCRRTRRARIKRPIGSQLPKVRSIYSCAFTRPFRVPSRQLRNPNAFPMPPIVDADSVPAVRSASWVPHPASLPLSFKERLKFVTVARRFAVRSLEHIEHAQHLGYFGRLIRHFSTPSIAFATAPSSSGPFLSPCHYRRDQFVGPNRGYTARNPSLSLSTKVSCRREGLLHFHFSTPSIAFVAAASAPSIRCP